MDEPPSSDFPRANISSIAACTKCSLSASKAEVASSSSKILGLRTSALAIAILCFWPPDSCTPRSPTSVSNWSGNSCMNPALASLAASLTSSSVGSISVPSSPYMMFRLILLAKRVGS
mmetsp:Transcript_3678/g.7594  ORF Transcript_3678/g.7594 Transcript_3678/m.7594 type:complete len:118 (+) Transcript_3678:254-607(+)